MEICYKGDDDKFSDKQTCCTRRMERKFTTSTEKDFYEVIRSTSSYLKNLISSNSAQYQGKTAYLNTVFHIFLNDFIQMKQVFYSQFRKLFYHIQTFIACFSISFRFSWLSCYTTSLNQDPGIFWLKKILCVPMVPCTGMRSSRISEQAWTCLEISCAISAYFG